MMKPKGNSRKGFRSLFYMTVLSVIGVVFAIGSPDLIWAGLDCAPLNTDPGEPLCSLDNFDGSRQWIVGKGIEYPIESKQLDIGSWFKEPALEGELHLKIGNAYFDEGDDDYVSLRLPFLKEVTANYFNMDGYLHFLSYDGWFTVQLYITWAF